MARYQPPHMRNRAPMFTEPQRQTPTPQARTSASSDPRDTTSPSPFAPISASQRPGPQRPQKSTRDWSKPAAQTPLTRTSHDLISSASGLRPSSRTDLHAVPVRSQGGKDMEFLQSVSRSGGDGADGDAWVRLSVSSQSYCTIYGKQLKSARLKGWELQERFRAYINDRVS